MTPFAPRAAAAELARLLDGAVTPHGAGQLPALAGLALRLQDAGAALPGPRPEFRDALRSRLMAVAAVQGLGSTAVPSPARAAGIEGAVSWSRARRGLGVAVGAMASVVVVAGVGVAGSQSLPGEPFYGVKRAVEGAQLRAADGALDRGTVHLAHAGERLDEVAALARGRRAVALQAGSGPVAAAGGADLVVQTLDDLDTSVRAAARLLTRASDDGTSPAPLQQLTGFAVQQDRELSALLPALPLAAQARAQDSLALSADVSADAVALIVGALGAQPAPTSTGPLLPGAPTTPGTAPAPALTPQPAPGGDGPALDPEGRAEQPGSPPASGQEPDAEPGDRPGAPTQPTATSRPSPRPTGGLPGPVPIATVPVPLPVPVPPVPVPVPVPVPPLPLPTSAPLPVPDVPDVPAVPDLPRVPDLPSRPVLPAAPVASAPVVSDVLRGLLRLGETVDHVLPADLPGA